MDVENADRPVAVATWKQVGALCLTIALATLGVTGFLVDRTLSGLDSSISELRTETGERFGGRENEDMAIRGLVKSTDEMLRVELQANRTEMTTALAKLGDRIVESNREVSGQLGQLRTELIDVTDKGDGQINGRFDRLEQKVDTLLGRISFEPTIELDQGSTYMIDTKGNLVDQKSGELMGTLPAVVTPVAPAFDPRRKP